MTPLLEHTLVRAQHVRSFKILPVQPGWEAVTSLDNQVHVERHLSDWHRVEQALRRFRLEIAALRNDGWQDA